MAEIVQTEQDYVTALDMCINVCSTIMNIIMAYYTIGEWLHCTYVSMSVHLSGSIVSMCELLYHHYGNTFISLFLSPCITVCGPIPQLCA